MGTDMDGTLSFQELLNDLPQNVSTHMAKNLSVPIAFVCLLHLANEKVGCAVIITLLLIFTNTYIDFVELLGKFVDLCI